MNVNPFSYLIEKLKGKVDKSGDTMSGMLKIDQQNGTVSTEGYSYIHLGNSTPTGTDKNSTGSIRLFASSGKYANIVAGNLTANRAIAFPDNGGTVALTSDFSDVKIYRHQISQQLSSGRTEIPIPSALTGKTIVGMTIKFGENIIPTAPVDDNGTYDQSYAIRSIVYGSNVIITTTSNWGTKTMNILFFYV